MIGLDFLYILEGHKVVSEPDFEKWLEWWRERGGLGSAHVAETKISGVRVSTVFLGTSTSISTKPNVFETMVFGGLFDRSTDRYSTWEEAEVGHARWVRKVEMKNA